MPLTLTPFSLSENDPSSTHPGHIQWPCTSPPQPYLSSWHAQENRTPPTFHTPLSSYLPHPHNWAQIGPRWEGWVIWKPGEIRNYTVITPRPCPVMSCSGVCFLKNTWRGWSPLLMGHSAGSLRSLLHQLSSLTFCACFSMNEAPERMVRNKSLFRLISLGSGKKSVFPGWMHRRFIGKQLDMQRPPEWGC